MYVHVRVFLTVYAYSQGVLTWQHITVPYLATPVLYSSRHKLNFTQVLRFFLVNLQTKCSHHSRTSPR